MKDSETKNIYKNNIYIYSIYLYVYENTLTYKQCQLKKHNYYIGKTSNIITHNMILKKRI